VYLLFIFVLREKQRAEAYILTKLQVELCPDLPYATDLRSAVRSGSPFVIQIIWGIVCG
jgi:hypothetical protein